MKSLWSMCPSFYRYNFINQKMLLWFFTLHHGGCLNSLTSPSASVTIEFHSNLWALPRPSLFWKHVVVHLWGPSKPIHINKVMGPFNSSGSRISSDRYVMVLFIYSYCVLCLAIFCENRNLQVNGPSLSPKNLAIHLGEQVIGMFTLEK